MINWILSNWYVVLGLIVLVLFLASFIYRFLNMPTATQIANIKEWLKWAVTEAEKELGTGTGQLKLRMVYDMAVTQFDWLAKFVSFDKFSDWVDEALVWLNRQLDSNNTVKSMIKKGEE